MLPLEHALKAFQNQIPERIPVCHFLGGSWPVLYKGSTLEELIGDPERTAQVFYQVNEEVDADIIMVGTGSTAMIIRSLGGEVRFEGKGAPSIMGELIKSEGDLENIIDIATAFKSSDIQWILETAQCLFNLAGRNRLILASGRAPFTLAGQMYGLEKLAKAIYKNPGFVHHLLEFTTRVSIAFFMSMVENGFVHGAFIADPSASGDVISKRHFEEFSLPYFIRVVAELKKSQAPIMLHICGDIYDRLPSIADTGIDCLSLDTKVNIAIAKQVVGDRICLAGNIDPVTVLEFGTPKDVVDSAKRCLEQGARNNGFVLMPGCDFGPKVTLENLKVLTKTAHQWKK